MPDQNQKKATSLTPQVVTLVIDDSGSMRDQDKCKIVTAGIQDLVIDLQAMNQGGRGTRFVVSIAKFGTGVDPLYEATFPHEINLERLKFDASSGGTQMNLALEWAARATVAAIRRCHETPGYDEARSPNPLVVILSDGQTGEDVSANAGILKSLPFTDGRVDVVAVGIAMEAADFPVMSKIASADDLSGNIPVTELSRFLAQVSQTLVSGAAPEDILR